MMQGSCVDDPLAAELRSAASIGVVVHAVEAIAKPAANGEPTDSGNRLDQGHGEAACFLRVRKRPRRRLLEQGLDQGYDADAFGDAIPALGDRLAVQVALQLALSELLLLGGLHALQFLLRSLACRLRFTLRALRIALLLLCLLDLLDQRRQTPQGLPLLVGEHSPSGRRRGTRVGASAARVRRPGWRSWPAWHAEPAHPARFTWPRRQFLGQRRGRLFRRRLAQRLQQRFDLRI